MSRNVIQYLKKRQFVDTLAGNELEKKVEKPLKVYVGFDPTAESLHLGNLLGIIALAHFQRHGHTPVVVLGGITARIGDPSGKSQERPLLSIETIQDNLRNIRLHFEQILDFSGKFPRPLILNNEEWFRDFNVIDFLREVGKHFRIGTMLAKESVRARFESEEGMSFTEFSYQLIQGYDFYFLHSQYDVNLQMGGSDQWGNITAGIELVRKISGRSVYGLTWPLLTRSDGKKFGKTEEGAIWLSSKKTSPYMLYQYLFRMPDADVIKMMKMLTFIEIEEIDEIKEEMGKKGYIPNTAQKRLAEEVTRIVHGEEGVKKALKATAGAAFGKESKLDGEILQEIAYDIPNIALPTAKVISHSYADLAAFSGLLSSKGEAIRILKNGGAYLNNINLLDPSYQISKKDLIDGKFLLLGAGKKKKILIKIKD